ncbi:MAG: hypothetical protein G3I11_00365 [Ferrovum sp.]|nr:hypothetical protein [Ferrovum sp.]
MTKRSILARGFWPAIVGGFLSGMGNGSVFGAATMCFLGRGKFAKWGGWFGPAFDPTTFSGFVDWAMLVFGLGFVIILFIALTRHNALENHAA